MFLDCKLDELKEYVTREYHRGRYDTPIGDEYLDDLVFGDVLAVNSTKTLAFMVAQIPEDHPVMQILDTYIRDIIKEYFMTELHGVIQDLREKENRHLMAAQMEYRGNQRFQSP